MHAAFTHTHSLSLISSLFFLSLFCVEMWQYFIYLFLKDPIYAIYVPTT